MCTSLRDIDLFMSSLRATKPHQIDPSIIPLDWDPARAQMPRKLRVGVMRSDGVVLPQPPMLRGFDAVVNKLEAAPDIEVKVFEPFKQRHGWSLMVSLWQGPRTVG
jgi:amidase